MEAATSRSRQSRSRITRGALYCGLYAAADDDDDDDDDDNDFDVIRRLSCWNEPHATW